MEGMGGFAGYNDSQKAWDTSQQAKLNAQKTLLDIQKEQGNLDDQKAASDFWSKYTAQKVLSQVSGSNRQPTGPGNPVGGLDAPTASSDGTDTVFEDAAKFAINAKAPWSITEPLLKQATIESFSRAQVANSRSNAQLHQIEAMKINASQFGAFAYAASQSPEAYSQIRMHVAQAPLVPKEIKDSFAQLPQDPGQGMQILKYKAESSMQVIEQMDQHRKDIVDERAAGQDILDAKLKEARTALAEARTRGAKQVADQRAKTQGPLAEASLRDKEMEAQNRELTAASKLAEYLPVPPGGALSDLVPGNKYKANDGSLFAYTKEKRNQWLSGPIKFNTKSATRNPVPTEEDIPGESSAGDEEDD